MLPQNQGFVSLPCSCQWAGVWETERGHSQGRWHKVAKGLCHSWELHAQDKNWGKLSEREQPGLWLVVGKLIDCFAFSLGVNLSLSLPLSTPSPSPPLPPSIPHSPPCLFSLHFLLLVLIFYFFVFQLLNGSYPNSWGLSFLSDSPPHCKLEVTRGCVVLSC